MRALVLDHAVIALLDGVASFHGDDRVGLHLGVERDGRQRLNKRVGGIHLVKARGHMARELVFEAAGLGEHVLSEVE